MSCEGMIGHDTTAGDGSKFKTAISIGEMVNNSTESPAENPALPGKNSLAESFTSWMWLIAPSATPHSTLVAEQQELAF